MELTLTQAEKFVASAPKAQWEGWNINIYQPEPNAFMRPNGSFYNNQWCLKFTVEPDSEGKYVISKRNAASASKSWN
jgi:hypothetical protein